MVKKKKIIRKVLAITNTRSEYDLLSYLYGLLTKDENIDFRIIVSGAHHSMQYGKSIKQIIDDGHKILIKPETQLDSDSDVGRIKSASLLMINAIEPVFEFSPDLLIYGADREEIMIAAMISGYLKIPSMHFYAGDHDRDGLIDNPLRHATSRMSAYQVVSMQEHYDRLIATGLNPKRIFNIGSCALDKFRKESKLNRRKLTEKLGGKGIFENSYALVIHHALMGEEQKCVDELILIIDALSELKLPAVINSPNIDPGSKKILEYMQSYQGNQNIFFINNLSRNLFINVYRNASIQIGNSSSGILEAPSIPLASVNVGNRMVGRRAMSNVIFSKSNKKSIKNSIEKGLSDDFYINNVKNIKNIYGDGKASDRAYKLIKNLDTSDYEKFRHEDPLDFLPSIDIINKYK